MRLSLRYDQAGMAVRTTNVIPREYRVYTVEAIVPLTITYGCHLIWPFVFDPLLHYVSLFRRI